MAKSSFICLLLGVFMVPSIFSMHLKKSWQVLNFKAIEQLGREDLKEDCKSAAYNKIRFIKAHKITYDYVLAILKRYTKGAGPIKPFSDCTAEDIKDLRQYWLENWREKLR